MKLGAVERRAMGALFLTVALMNTATVLSSTAGNLLASEVGGPAMSGVPSAAGILGTAFGAWLAGSLTARRGRRFALLTGYGIATFGGVVTSVGAVSQSLAVLLPGLVALGTGNGAAQMSRYLAADLYPPERSGFAISAVIWAGTVGALVGPMLIAPTAAAAEFLGLPSLSGPLIASAIAVACTALAALVVPSDETRETPRAVPLSDTLRLPALRFPLAAMVAAQLTMIAVMSMTPPHLHHHGQGLDVVGWILTAHITGMFALSPLSGRIADRIGGRATVGSGLAVLVLASVLAMVLPESYASGIPVALFLLGYGWNLVVVGGSALLSKHLPPQSRGAVDAVIWGSSVFSSIGAGSLFGFGGYSLVAAVAGVLALVPMVFWRSKEVSDVGRAGGG